MGLVPFSRGLLCVSAVFTLLRVARSMSRFFVVAGRLKAASDGGAKGAGCRAPGGAHGLEGRARFFGLSA